MLISLLIKKVSQTQGNDVALASYQGYEGNDKGEAQEWLRAKAKGIDMSTAGRMKRAKAMGFSYDTDSLIVEKAREQGKLSVLQAVKRGTEPSSNKAGRAGLPQRPDTFYHGTADNILGFRAAHSNRKDNGWLGSGIYIRDSRGMANYYAAGKKGADQPNVIPLYARIQNPYIATLAEKTKYRNSTAEIST